MNKILQSANRIKDYIIKTPTISNKKLNEELGAQIFFKMENRQITGSFKARGAFNAILSQEKLPEKIVVQSSGNHAQAVAYACKKFKIKSLIYMISRASPLKIKAAQDLGAEVVLLEKRADVNKQAEEKRKEGYLFIHPSANEDVILGQGTSALEAILEIGEVDFIFAPCGGGGLVSGCFLAAKEFSPKAKVFACEPLNANDVARSVREKRIVGFDDTPDTIADGARTLSTSEICFNYLSQITGVLEIEEEEIIFWQKKISAELNQKIEPTSALAIAGAAQFLQKNPQAKNSKILVIISGGNVA